MAQSAHIHFYGYVARPYAAVRGLLHARPQVLLARATTSAAKRAQELSTHLRFDTGGVEVGVEIRTTVLRVHDEEPVAGLSPVTRVEIRWEAAHAQAFFPLMHAELSAWPTLSDETQLDIEGDYRPPLGAFGKLLDATLLHRVAQASVHRLLEDVIGQIAREVPA